MPPSDVGSLYRPVARARLHDRPIGSIEYLMLASPPSSRHTTGWSMLRARIRDTIRLMKNQATAAVEESQQMARAAERMAAGATATSARASASTARALARQRDLPRRTT